ncbi:unnamed protein product [Symbiodinium sp. KB8]|nr:unnamed protein product [Symbiodinium sp. KB8]
MSACWSYRETANFATMTFRESKRSRAIVLWYTPKHVDLILPHGEPYPEALFTQAPGQTIDLRAGGRSQQSVASCWTRASNAPSEDAQAGVDTCLELQNSSIEVKACLAAPIGPVGELCAGPPQDTAEPAARQRRRSSSLAQKGICKGVFQRELCPFRKKLDEVSKLLDVRKRFHRENHHPMVTPKEWMLLLQKQGRESMIAKRRVTSLNAGAASIARTQLPAHLTPVLMPTPIMLRPAGNMPKKNHATVIRKVTFLNRLKCHRYKRAQLNTLEKVRGAVFAVIFYRRGISSVDAVQAMVADHQVSIAFFQEVDIHRQSAVGFANLHAQGRSCLEASNETGSITVAIGRGPIGRRRGGMAHAGGYCSRARGMFLGYPSDLARTSEAYEALMEAIAVYGGLFVVLGDFNCTQQEGALSTSLVCGAVRPADDSCDGPPMATNPVGTRRSDFAVMHPDLVARREHTFRLASISDHGIVRYDFESDNCPPPLDVTALLAAGRVDEAWARISDWAEAFLGTTDPAQPQSRPWPPRPRLASHDKPGSSGHEPPALGALRKLSYRLAQLQHRPWDRCLFNRTAASLRRTRHLAPDLPHLDLENPELAAAMLQPVLTAHQDAHRRRCLERWRQKVTTSVEDAVTWVKHRAEQECRLQSNSPLEEAEAYAVHPVDRVEQQGEIWTRKWQLADTPPDVEDFQRILQELRRAMAKMKKKAPGPDNWTGALLLRMPPNWWRAFSALWRTIVQQGRSTADMHQRILRAWRKGVRSYVQQALNDIRMKIVASLSGALTQEAPRILVGQVLGWTLDVHWMADWSALAYLLRTLTSPQEWLEDIVIAELNEPRTSDFPAAAHALQCLHWQLEPGYNRCITRTDDEHRRRVFRIGVDSPSVLKQRLIEEYKLTTTTSCGRVLHKLHRNTPGLAVGLDLPKPGSRVRFAFEGHRKAYTQARDAAQQRAALATGGTGWHYRAKLRGEGVATCMCGQTWPSRAHLVWTCPILAHDRGHLVQPMNRAEERLFGRSIAEYPPAPSAHTASPQPALAAFFAAAAQDAILDIDMATDGSSQSGVGAHAIVCEIPEVTISAADDAEDQAAFRMELQAVCEVLVALATTAPPRTLRLLVDCDAVGKAIRRRTCGPRAWHVLADHRKQREWAPEAPLTSDFCRRLNQSADDAANQLRRRRLAGSERAAWADALQTATSEECDAVLFAASAARRLEAHLCTANSESRPRLIDDDV